MILVGNHINQLNGKNDESYERGGMWVLYLEDHSTRLGFLEGQGRNNLNKDLKSEEAHAV